MGERAQPRSRRRAVVAALVALLLVAATGCEPGPPAPAPVPPTSPAPAGTVRAELEAWVASHAYPWILGRSASTGDTLVWGDRLVRDTPAGVGLILAVSFEARRRIARAHLRTLLGREPAGDAVAYWGGWLATHSVDQLDSVLAGSSELRSRFPVDGAWLDQLAPVVLGRALSASERASFLQALASGSRGAVARFLVTSRTARIWRAGQAYGALGFPPPSGSRVDLRVGQLSGAGGNDLVVRAALAVDRAPARVRTGVAGDSVGFDLFYRAGGRAMGTSILAPIEGAGRIGCGVLSTDPQYQVFGGGGAWKPIADGRCPIDVVAMEAAMLRDGVDVVIWQIGAWETARYRNAQGVVLADRSAAFRTALVSEAVRRIDRWVAGGVRRVLLPEWACVGGLASATHRDPAFSRFIRTVLDGIVAARPSVAVVAPTPPQVCVGGDPVGPATREHRVAREDAFHWISGPRGAEWGWRMWFAPAVADLPGLR